jgi:hypothetical protein
MQTPVCGEQIHHVSRARTGQPDHDYRALDTLRENFRVAPQRVVDQEAIARVAHQVAVQHGAMKAGDFGIAVPRFAQHPQPLAKIFGAEVRESRALARRIEDRLLAEVDRDRLAPRECPGLRLAQARRGQVVDVNGVGHGRRS